MLDAGMPKNMTVKILKRKNGWIRVSPLTPLPPPRNLAAVQSGVGGALADDQPARHAQGGRSPHRFTKAFTSVASREALDPRPVQKRLLLCLYGFGTNTGLKRIAAREHGESYADLRYVRRRYITSDTAGRHRAVVNAIFGRRTRRSGARHDGLRLGRQEVRGLGPEPDDRVAHPLRRPRRDDLLARGEEVGVHLLATKTLLLLGGRRDDRGRAAPLHRAGRSRRTTSTSHGQSEVAFAFCHLLGFQLLPRLKGLHAQKLYRPETGSRQPIRACSPCSPGPSTGS